MLAAALNTEPLSKPLQEQVRQEQVEEQINKPELPETNPELLEWVEKLKKKENCPQKGMIDVDGTLSIANFCFKKGTFNQYSKKLGILGIITNNEDQKELVVAMIEDDYNNFKHWRCSVITDRKRCPKSTWGKGIGLPPKP